MEIAVDMLEKEGGMMREGVQHRGQYEPESISKNGLEISRC